MEFGEETNVSDRMKLLKFGRQAYHVTEEFINYAKEHVVYLTIFSICAAVFIHLVDLGISHHLHQPMI